MCTSVPGFYEGVECGTQVLELASVHFAGFSPPRVSSGLLFPDSMHSQPSEVGRMIFSLAEGNEQLRDVK